MSHFNFILPMLKFIYEKWSPSRNCLLFSSIYDIYIIYSCTKITPIPISLHRLLQLVEIAEFHARRPSLTIKSYSLSSNRSRGNDLYEDNSQIRKGNEIMFFSIRFFVSCNVNIAGITCLFGFVDNTDKITRRAPS